MPKESNFKVSGRIKNNETGYDEDFKLFVKGLDRNHAVMIAKDYLRRNAPVLDNGKLLGSLIIEKIEEKFSQ